MESTTTRKEAKAAGHLTYYTGRVCANGHRALRRTDNGSCVECARAARNRQQHIKGMDAKARSNGARIFVYELHPKDHAAALAFCQMLDAAAGRKPSLGQVPAREIVWRSREEVLADNAARLNRLQPPAAPPHPFKP